MSETPHYSEMPTLDVPPYNEEIATWSGDVLRDKANEIEGMLEVIFLNLAHDKERDGTIGPGGVLTETFWLRLGRNAEAEEARRYQLLQQELERRKE